MESKKISIFALPCCYKGNLADINWKRLASFRCDESRHLITASLLSGMKKNALLLVDLYITLYIDQERELFFLSMSRGCREPITVDES